MADNRKVPCFFQSDPSTDVTSSERYKRIRDDPEESAERVHIESMWQAFAPYCGDPFAAFLGDARQNFAARLWEMRIASILLDAGYELRRPQRDGPDLGVRHGNSTVWVEAVAVEPGDGPDAVPPLPIGRAFFSLNRDKILLRYTSALLDKRKQRDAFIRRKAIHDSDAYVIAINAGAIHGAGFDRKLPEIVRAVYPIGDPVWRVPVFDADVEVRSEHPHRAKIPRTSQKDGIKASAFLDPFFGGVSALLFAPNDPLHTGPIDLILVHNARALAPIPHGFFTMGREYGVTRDDQGQELIGPLVSHHAK